MLTRVIVIISFFLAGCSATNRSGGSQPPAGVVKQATEILREQVMTEAAWALRQEPVTITAFVSPRSAGGRHDFFSEGDYWWPDPAHPDSPYVQRDGLTNPENFTEHRKAMIRFSRIIGALASAYQLTGDKIYVMQAMQHARAWFVDTATRMNPNLLYAQAIKGRVTGRSIGIIDTIHLLEVVQGLWQMEGSAYMNKHDLQAIRNWFEQYLHWLTTHPYGVKEMKAKNNHGTCWVMQVAAFARFTGNKKLMDFCRTRFKEVLLPDQMARDGSFPLELNRTKPYGYSIFNLDAMATICQTLSDADHDLWNYQASDGRCMKKAIAFLVPYIRNKSRWPYPHDVLYWDNWPVAQPFLLFGAQQFGNAEWLNLWKGLDHAPAEEEVLRNLPVRHPLIWL